MMVYFFFKPLNIKEQKFVDVPLFEISSFTMYEMDKVGLKTIMMGSSAVKYNDERYVVKDMDYTDNAKAYKANMKADNGIYKEDLVKLNGNVIYVREDGLTFETQSVLYNTKTSIAISDTNYTSYKNNNIVTGSYIKYDNINNVVESKDVVATYHLGETRR
jgi:LPS export ABC transporter protein LptC